MKTVAIKSGNGIIIALVALSTSACGTKPYNTMFTSLSPDGKYVATLLVSEEGTLGSTRYKLDVSKKSGDGRSTVFQGDNADVGPPVWLGGSSIIVPFCFGSIAKVDSILPEQSDESVKFRGRASSSLRVHIITSPNTIVAGKAFCTDHG